MHGSLLYFFALLLYFNKSPSSLGLVSIHYTVSLCLMEIVAIVRATKLITYSFCTEDCVCIYTFSQYQSYRQ